MVIYLTNLNLKYEKVNGKLKTKETYIENIR